MNRILSLLPVAAMAAGSLLAVAVLSASPSAAQTCQKDAGGGCKTDGARCSPPNGGRCYTVKERRVLNCVCSTTKPPNALRSTRRPVEVGQANEYEDRPRQPQDTAKPPPQD